VRRGSQPKVSPAVKKPDFPFAPLKRRAYGAIVADPPWRFSGNSAERPGRNPRRHYRCMTVTELCEMPAGVLAADDCRLFLWVTAPFLAAGLHLPVVAAWGFRPSTVVFTWVKTNRDGSPFTGNGYHSRQNPEFVVLGVRGSPARASRSVHSVILAPRREHSRKPDDFYDRVATLTGDVARAELFAREERPGWDAWGDEVGKF